MPIFFIRKADAGDLDAIAEIFTDGREFLGEQGLPQWQNDTGPSRADACEDIENNEGFVLSDRIGTVCGYAALIKGPDEIYTAIRPVHGAPGTWDETFPEYVSIHRVALSAVVRGKGLAKFFMEELIKESGRQGFHDIRIDTHERNTVMRKVIETAGFSLRGEVEFPFQHGERLAYQQLVSRKF